MSTSPVFKVSPSDLTFLWDSCTRCFWMKNRADFRRPAGAFPRIFSTIDGIMKDHFYAKRTEEISPSLPPGRITFGGRRVRSKPLAMDGHVGMLVIEGNIDTAASFDDGGHAILDFKTSEPKSEHVPFYWRQLNAYALAAENPGRGALHLEPVTHLGLLCLEPIGMSGTRDEPALECRAQYLDVPRDDDAFEVFLHQVLSVLENDDPPLPADDCPYCRYIKVGSLVLATEMYQQEEGE